MAQRICEKRTVGIRYGRASLRTKRIGHEPKLKSVKRGRSYPILSTSTLVRTLGEFLFSGRFEPLQRLAMACHSSVIDKPQFLQD